MKDIIIVGAGGLAKDIFTHLKASLQKYERIKGILADDEEKFITSKITTRYLGTINDYQPLQQDRFLVCFGTQPMRTKIFCELQTKGAKFHNFIHPTVILPSHYHIGEGVIIGAYCTIGEHSFIGNNVFVNKFVNIGHDSSIHDHTILCPYVMIAGGASVGKSSFLSTRVSLAPQTHIGNYCTISAHSFIKTDIADSTFAYPQTILKQRKI